MHTKKIRRPEQVRFALYCAAVWLAFVALALTGSAHASFIVSDSASMSDLLTGDSLFAGGTEFSDWSVNNALATGGVLAVDPADVTVRAGVDGDKVGLQFLLAAAAGAGQSVDLDFTYKVSSELPLVSAHSLMDGGAAVGTGVVSIAETLFEVFPGTPVGSLSVSALNVGTLIDHAVLDPAVNMLIARKDVVLSGGVDGTAALSSFIQLFQQVPEPATGMNLMIALLIGWGTLRLCR